MNNITDKKVTIILILFLAFTVFAGYLIASTKRDSVSQIPGVIQPGSQKTSDIIIFYGDGCPHCALVERFIAKNNTQAKVAFYMKEVYHNQQNAVELSEKAKLCGLRTDYIDVPLLWDGTKCLVGDQDINEFFKLKISEQQ